MSEIHEVKGQCGKNLMKIKIWKQGGVIKCLEGEGTILTYPKPDKIKVSHSIIEICYGCQVIKTAFSKRKRTDGLGR